MKPMKLLPLLAATLSLSISVSASAQVTGKYISTVPGIRHSGVVTNMQTDGAPTLLTTGNKCPMVKMNSGFKRKTYKSESDLQRGLGFGHTFRHVLHARARW